jgi:hypothetical protein
MNKKSCGVIHKFKTEKIDLSIRIDIANQTSTSISSGKKTKNLAESSLKEFLYPERRPRFLLQFALWRPFKVRSMVEIQSALCTTRQARYLRVARSLPTKF